MVFLNVYLSYVPLFLFLTVQIKSLMQFGFYNPETLNNILAGDVSPKV